MRQFPASVAVLALLWAIRLAPAFSSEQAPPVSAVQGTVAESDGTAVGGASVEVFAPEGHPVGQTISAADGSFALNGLQPGNYRVSIARAGYLEVSQEIHLPPAETRLLEVTLAPDPRETLHERVTVVGTPSGVEVVPGSAAYLDTSQLQRQYVAFGDIHRFLRQIPGVYIQEEEGFGLRPNIGMRGSGTDRSSGITLMEDGVLTAPAPYAAPAAYYFPVVARMKGIEVRKGSSQIKYGPRTHGGALNLISTPIPDDFQVNGDASFGSFSSRNFYLNLGDSHTHFGWLAETYQIASKGFKQLDGGGDTGFGIHDYLLKFRLHTDLKNPRYQQLEFKFGRTTQESDETYLGLTDEDFQDNPLRRYAASQEDVFDSGFRQLQVRHFAVVANNVDVTTVVYRNDFARNWYKLNGVLNRSLADVLENPGRFASELRVLRGTDSEPNALAVRANNREYYAYGVQSILGFRLVRGNIRQDLELGLRYHRDQEDRFQHDDNYQMLRGHMLLTRKGQPGSQENRIGDARAWAFFMQDRLEWGDWSVMPGLRYENIELVRTDYSRSDTTRSGPTQTRLNTLNVVIPGLGLKYSLKPTLALFGGVHRGFAPPSPGSTNETKAENSVNYEMGVRWTSPHLKTELLGFFNRYTNLLGRDTLSSGGQGTGDLFNGGRSNVQGLELSLATNLGSYWSIPFEMPIRLAYTLSRGEFRNSFQSQFEPWGNVHIGDKLPYIPSHQLDVAAGLSRGRWSMDVESTYAGRMRTVAGQGPIRQREATDAHLVLNISGEYRLTEDGTRFFLSIQNLTDREYVAARHPSGVRPGLPRTFLGGIRFSLGR
ncbi:MAG: TonB-dependent receptor [Acidobacteria bacterium]|nr:TonB-dependent receptor [Acidobacteriota bacterium]